VNSVSSVVNTYLGLTLAQCEIAATGQYMAFLRSLKGLILQIEVNKQKTQLQRVLAQTEKKSLANLVFGYFSSFLNSALQ
jgi:hypothetical protein